jgi:glucosamine--fructose-6-phosphate aminotransferase (isomerizing)
LGDPTSDHSGPAGLPELRASPPWVMEEMIAALPSIPERLDRQGSGLRALALSISEVATAGGLVTVVGCGTSEHAAVAVAELLNEALATAPVRKPSVVARQAMEAALDPWGEDVCIGVSHEGETGATIAAMEMARHNGALTGLITAKPEGRAAGVADHVIETPMRDRSYCHTVGYVSPIIAGAMLAARLQNRNLDPTSVSDHLRAGFADVDQVATVADTLNGARRVIAVGSGIDRVGAREFALKVEEGVRMPANATDLETLLHGHLVACDSSTAIVLFVADPRLVDSRTERAKRLLRASNRLGIRTAAIVSPALADQMGELATAGHVVTRESASLTPVLAALMGSAVKLQLLSVRLVLRTGKSPDLIRREEAAYREAAELVESTWP